MSFGLPSFAQRSATTKTMVLLQFSPLQSAPSPSFFHALTKHKLDVARLDDSLVSIKGEYSEGKIVLDREGGKGDEVGISGGVELGLSSFEVEGEAAA